MLSISGKTWCVNNTYTGDIVSILAKNRGINEIERFKEFSFETGLHDPRQLPDAEKAARRIEQAIEQKEKILIYGDYDADGITSAALMHEFFRYKGCEVTVRLPHREQDGYGFRDHIARWVIENRFDLVITVDCGISNADQINIVQDAGIDVIITDHHTVQEVLPKAYAIVHPARPDSVYPYRGLCGVGVAYKLVTLLLEHDENRDTWLKWALDLVAIGTVADCSDILGENRVLVYFGLKVLKKTKRPGLKALYEVAGIHLDTEWTTETIGFRIAPRLNAAGRLDDPFLAFELLVAEDDNEAKKLALKLHQLNTQRQEMTMHVVEKAHEIVEKRGHVKLLVIKDDSIPPGVIGLVAGKMVEAYGRPSIVMTENNGKIVGSMRSIPSCNIMEFLPQMAEHLEEFGGHAQAAGFTVSPRNVASFVEQFEKLIEEHLSDDQLIPAIDIDVEIDLSDVSFSLFKEIKSFEPFGMGNQKPIFMSRNVRVDYLKKVGANSQHLKCIMKHPDGTAFGAICFNADIGLHALRNGETYDIVYCLEENAWNGTVTLQLHLLDAREAN